MQHLLLPFWAQGHCLLLPARELLMPVSQNLEAILLRVGVCRGDCAPVPCNTGHF
jgi:hypothetical protein